MLGEGDEERIYIGWPFPSILRELEKPRDINVM